MSKKPIVFLPLLALSMTLSAMPTAHAQELLAASEVPAEGTTDGTADGTARLFATPAEKDSADAQPYSASGAVTWSVFGTGVGLGILAVAGTDDSGVMVGAGLMGLTLGPSAGHMYTGDWKRVLLGSGLRATGLTAAIFGYASMIDESCYGECLRPRAALLIGGLAAFAGGTLYSIIDSGYSARRANRAERRLQLTPAPITGPDRSTGMGMMLGGTF